MYQKCKIYSENYNILFKEIKDLNKWKNIPCSWILKLHLVKMSILPKLFDRFTMIYIRIPDEFLVKTDKPILKFLSNCKEPRTAKTTLKKKKKVGRLLFPDFKTCYKAVVLKTVWDWHKDKQIDPQNRTESPEINPYLYDQLNTSRVPKPFNGERTAFFINTLGTRG